MKNTIENKARFFAQYWGQRVLIRNYDNPVYDDKIILNEFNYDGWLSIAILELTPLSQITDEHAKWIIEKENFIGLFEDVVLSEDFLNYLIGIKNGKCNKYEVIDYIRKKGYALPFEDISVDEQIEFGWIKLK